MGVSRFSSWILWPFNRLTRNRASIIELNTRILFICWRCVSFDLPGIVTTIHKTACYHLIEDTNYRSLQNWNLKEGARKIPGSGWMQWVCHLLRHQWHDHQSCKLICSDRRFGCWVHQFQGADKNLIRIVSRNGPRKMLTELGKIYPWQRM